MVAEKMMSWTGTAWLLLVASLGASRGVAAHCDGLDGPVVTAARKALETGDVNHVLIWVQEADEGEIRRVFEEALAVRKLSPQARELADRYFFETLVRVHRAGEGASFTGLKPAGRDLGPAIPAADRAIQTASADPLVQLLRETMEEGLGKAFQRVIEAKNFAASDLRAGREYVEAYVSFVHYVEDLYQTAIKESPGHFAETEAPAHKHD